MPVVVTHGILQSSWLCKEALEPVSTCTSNKYWYVSSTHVCSLKAVKECHDVDIN